MDPADELLEHYGVKGMHWGIRKDPDTGVRPLAKSMSKGVLGRAAQKNVNRHNARASAASKRRSDAGRDPRSPSERLIHRLMGVSLAEAQRRNRSHTRRTMRNNRSAGLPARTDL